MLQNSVWYVQQPYITYKRIKKNTNNNNLKHLANNTELPFNLYYLKFKVASVLVMALYLFYWLYENSKGNKTILAKNLERSVNSNRM